MPAVMPIMPDLQLPKQNWAGSGTSILILNQQIIVYEQIGHPVILWEKSNYIQGGKWRFHSLTCLISFSLASRTAILVTDRHVSLARYRNPSSSSIRNLYGWKTGSPSPEAENCSRSRSST